MNKNSSHRKINCALKSLRLGSFVAALIVATLASAQQEPARTVAFQIDEVMRSHAAAKDFSGSVLVAHDDLADHCHLTHSATKR